KGTAPSAEAMQRVIATLEAKAKFDGATHLVSLRVGGDDSAIYIDIGDATWKTIQVTPGGYELVKQSDVRFRRTGRMRPLATPEKGGPADLIKKFAKVPESEFWLFIAWVCAALRPVGPYPVLQISGIQGSAKSTITAVIRKLIDDNAALMRSPPKEPRDLAI